MNKFNFKEKYNNILDHIRQEKRTFAIYLILRALVIVVMIAQFFNKNYENVFLCILTLVLFLLPSVIEMKFKIDLPGTFEIIIMLFIFAAEILGEINEYYIVFPFWDTMLHTINGFLAAAIGFSLVDILNRTEKVSFHLSPFFMALVAFCFSMTIGIIWEFFEFAMDYFFQFDMQKDTIIHSISTVKLDPLNGNNTVIIDNITSVAINGQDLGLGGYLDIGLYDTMKDLLVNLIGAIVFSVIGYFYILRRGIDAVATHFIVTKVAKQIDEVEE